RADRGTPRDRRRRRRRERELQPSHATLVARLGGDHQPLRRLAQRQRPSRARRGRNGILEPRQRQRPRHRQAMNSFIVFAKEPEAGKVKTRLTPPLTPAQAVTLYTAFVEDVTAAIASCA